MKKAISITLETENLLWLRGQAQAADGNVSEIVDRHVDELVKDLNSGSASDT